MYIFGGISYNNNYFNKIWQYDIQKNNVTLIIYNQLKIIVMIIFVYIMVLQNFLINLYHKYLI